MDDERWVPVVGFEGLYEVSDLGRVRSIPRPSTRGVVLVPSVKRNGYQGVKLVRDGRIAYRTVHRVVLEAFTGPCPPGMIACHGPAGKRDNSPGNLSWGTHAKNLGPDKRRDGTMQCGERSGMSKLTELKVREIRALYNTGYTRRQIADRYEVTQSAIDGVLSGRTWKHVI